MGRKGKEGEKKRRRAEQGGRTVGRAHKPRGKEENRRKKEEKGEEMKGKRRREDRVGRRGEPGEERREAARQRGKGRDPAPRGPCASWPRRWPPCWPQPQPQVSGTAVEQRPDPGPGSPLWVACGISGSASG